jgi:filamentous hemagglutinin
MSRQLGGMYAGKITFLVGTEQGLGVRNAGSIGASNGNLIVTSAGRLENAGTLEGTRVELASAGDIDNRGGTIRQTSSTGLAIARRCCPTRMAASSVLEPFPGNAGPRPAQAPEAVPAPAQATTGTTTPTAGTGHRVHGRSGTLTGTVCPASPGTLTAAGTMLNDGGKIYAGGPISLQSANVNNNGGALSVASMAVSQPTFDNHGRHAERQQRLQRQCRSIRQHRRHVERGQPEHRHHGRSHQRRRQADQCERRHPDHGRPGRQHARDDFGAGALTANVAGAVNNTGGTLVANQGVKLSAGSLDNTQGSIQSAQAGVQLAVANQLANGSAGTINAATDLASRPVRSPTAAACAARTMSVSRSAAQ